MHEIERARRELTIEQKQQIVDAYRRWEREEMARRRVHPLSVVRRLMGLYVQPSEPQSVDVVIVQNRGGR